MKARYHSARVHGAVTARELSAELRRTIAERKRLLARYEGARSRLERAGSALAGLLAREDFRALLRAEGIDTVPAPAQRFLRSPHDG
jgi:hypothetical protein